MWLTIEPSNLARIWEKYYPYLSHDYSFETVNQPEKVLAQTCYAINRYLDNMNMSFASYGLTHLCKCKETFGENTRDITDPCCSNRRNMYDCKENAKC